MVDLMEFAKFNKSFPINNSYNKPNTLNSLFGISNSLLVG